MSEYRVYNRKTKRAKISSAVEEKKLRKEQCCLVPGTPAKPPPGRTEAKRVYRRRSRKKLEEKVCDLLSDSSFSMFSSNENTLFGHQELNCDKSSANCVTMNSSVEKNVLLGSCMALTDKNKDQSSDKTESIISLGSVGIIDLKMSLDSPGLIGKGKEHNSDGIKGLCLEPIGSTAASKEKELSFDGIEGTCSGYDEGSNEQVMQIDEGDSTFLVSAAAIEGLDILDSGEMNKGLNDWDSVVSYVPFIEPSSLSEPKASQPYAMSQAAATDKKSENFPLIKEIDSEKLSSNLKFVQEPSSLSEPKASQPYAMSQAAAAAAATDKKSENFSFIKEIDSEKLSSNLDNGLMRENEICDEIHVNDCLHSKNRIQKPRRKKHRPKVLIDVRPTTPKPATPKQAREKKPKLATPKQTKEKKPKQAKEKKSENVRKQRSSGLKEVIIKGTSVSPSDIKSNLIIEINETKAPVARALDFQWENLDAKPVDSALPSLPNKKKRSKRRRKLNENLDAKPVVSALPSVPNKKRRSKRRRKLNWFTFTVMSVTKNVKNNKKILFTVNWFGRKRRIQMKRPHKVTEVDAKINAAFSYKPSLIETDTSVENAALFIHNHGLESHSNTVIDNNGLVGFEICENTLVTTDGLVTDKRLAGFKVCDNTLVTDVLVTDKRDLSIISEASTSEFQKNSGKRKRKATTSDDPVKPKGRRGFLSKKYIDFIIDKLQSLHISDDTLVSYQGPFNPTKKKKSPKVVLDSETVRVWNLLMDIDDDRIEKEASEENEKWWEKEREVFAGRIASFIARMHHIQGDRGFKKWKGSVLDSVIGVLLTQNVTDHYSSNVFMSLAAKFPPKPTSQSNSCDIVVGNSQESVESSMVTAHTEYDEEGNQYFVNEPVLEKKNGLEKATDGLVGGSSSMISSVDKVVQSQHDDATAFSTKRGRSKIPKAKEHDFSNMGFDKKRKSISNGKKKSYKEEKKIDWESLRIKYSTGQRNSDQMDSIDWEAVRLADVNEVAGAIQQRGQHNILATTIQNLLNLLVNLHNCLELEWLRNTPPDLAKKYLLDIKGLGLKSVECIRLLSLEQTAFPVDVNVARIVIRLGWVPLQPLPEELQIHLLELYPILDSIQIYLWPRLCTLPQRILYLLHYHFITFGKVICTSRNPNCKACPMRDNCRHFESQYGSTKNALPHPSDKMKSSSAATLSPLAPASSSEAIPILDSGHQTKICEPIIEEPFEPPAAKLEAPESQEPEIEYDSEGIPIIKLNLQDFKTTLHRHMNEKNLMFEDGEVSNALVALNSGAASIPARKLKQKSRLRVEHLVYELPRNHVLLQGLEQTESDKDVQYHLAIWRPGETADSSLPPKKRCNSTESELCNEETCFSCNNIREQNANIVRGTILIPYRVANRDSFPLNGTYFQMNEVFADHETSLRPINVPRNLIYNLRTRIAYFGSSISTILRGESMEDVQKCFWTGIICNRGFERSVRAPRPLQKRLYCPPNQMEKIKREPRFNVGKDKKIGKKKSKKLIVSQDESILDI